uniref:Uncharacterized protein n=1 Tax=Anguilla anguilla TaxID=7936 RepID=A0A0E9WG13_ANGAN
MVCQKDIWNSTEVDMLLLRLQVVFPWTEYCMQYPRHGSQGHMAENYIAPPWSHGL